MTAAWKFFEKFRCTLQKNCFFSMPDATYKTFWNSLLSHVSAFFLEKNQFNICFGSFSKTFHAAHENFHACYSLLHAIKMSFGNLLFHGFFFDLQKLSSRSIFHDYAKIGFLKEFLNDFCEYVEILTKIVELNCLSVATSNLIFGIKSIPRKYKPPFYVSWSFVYATD